MAGGVDISLIGDKELQRKFKTLVGKVQKKIARKAIRAGAKIVLADAKNRAPVLSGKLKKSLKVKAIKRSRSTIGVLVQTGTREKLNIPEGSKYYYPAAVEYGHGGVAAKPFLRPALDTNADRALSTIQRELWNGIRIEGAKP